jgi:hypothetical protein
MGTPVSRTYAGRQAVVAALGPSPTHRGCSSCLQCEGRRSRPRCQQQAVRPIEAVPAALPPPPSTPLPALTPRGGPSWQLNTSSAAHRVCSVKAGGPDPVANSKLSDLLKQAKELGVPKDVIERNLKRASDTKQGDFQECM